MKMKLVLMKSDYGADRPIEDDGDLSYYLGEGYVLLSEPVEVDFPELPNETIVNGQIAVIDKKIQQVMAKSEAAITKLKARKQELLAICHDDKSEEIGE